MIQPTPSVAQGRPAATTHAELERVAFQLFASQGFKATTLQMIADEVGVSRRTVTRYYPSKNDIPWGQFDQTLADFRDLLATMPRHRPLWQRVQRGVIEFNRFPDDAQPSHRDRMRLILGTPALQAHSVLRYAQWRAVIAEYVAAETGLAPTDPLPNLIGHVSLALSVSAYEQWLDEPEDGRITESDLAGLIRRATADLRTYVVPES